MIRYSTAVKGAGSIRIGRILASFNKGTPDLRMFLTDLLTPKSGGKADAPTS